MKPKPAEKPDPQTGRPRPPKAFVWRQWGDSSDQDRNFHPPAPPDGRGQPLEWWAQKNSTHWSGAVWFVVIVIGVLSLIHMNISWIVDLWYIPLGAAIIAALLARGKRGMFYSAGADWLQDKQACIDTYQLVEVYVYSNTDYTTFIELNDNNGQRVHAVMSDLQANQQLWDLVYNGIVTSVVNGARIKGLQTPKALNLEEYLREGGSIAEGDTAE